MRNTDELMLAIMEKSETVKERRSAKKAQIVYGLCACACFVLLFVVGAVLPTVNANATDSMEQHYGSLILRTPYMGYVVIGVLAFAAGVFLTLLFRNLYAVHHED